MKVICINSKSVKPWGYTQLEEGRIYEVELTTNHCGKDGYLLLEGGYLPTVCSCGTVINNGAIYVTSKFVPLSEIDEKEFERNYNKQLT